MTNPTGSCLDQLLAVLAIPMAVLMMLLSFGSEMLGLDFDVFGDMPALPQAATAFPPPTMVPLTTPTPTAVPSVVGDAGIGQFQGEIVPGGGDVWTYEGTE